YFPDPDLVPVAPSREWVRQLADELPEKPWERRKRMQQEWQLTDEELRDLDNTGAAELVAATVDAGASPDDARSWWVQYLTQQANERAVELADLPITPGQLARVLELVSTGELTNKLARDVVAAVLAGEGEPDTVIEQRGLQVVSDDSALLAAVDEALAAQPDVVEKIRGGKVQAAGAIVGAVMKATQGQADAKRVRELIMERAGAGAHARPYPATETEPGQLARVARCRCGGPRAGGGLSRLDRVVEHCPRTGT